MRILIVESEKELNKTISNRLREENYIVDSCYDGSEAYDYLTMAEYDGVILDIALPKMNGFDLLEKLRRDFIKTPIMLVSDQSSEEDIVRGLNLGADDFLAKPFSIDVLIARLRVMLRRSVNVHENRYVCGDLELWVTSKIVIRQGKRIDLTPKEYAILEYMIRNQNIILTREQFENNVWDANEHISSNVVDVYIRYLRKKIDDNYKVKLIQTIRGVGYRFGIPEDN